MKRELLNNTQVVYAAQPSTNLSAGDTNGLVIDRLNCNSAVISIATGAATGTPTAQSVVAKVYHGDASDGSDAVPLVDRDGNNIELAAITADNASTQLDVDILGAKKYLQIRFTTTFTGGTAPTIPVAGVIVLGDSEDTRAL